MRDDTVIRCAVLKGLKPYIRSYVSQQNAKTISDVFSSGRFAGQTMSVNRSLLTNLRQGRHVAELEAQLKKLATTLEPMSLGSVGAPTETATPSSLRARSRQARRVLYRHFLAVQRTDGRACAPSPRLRAPPRRSSVDGSLTNLAHVNLRRCAVRSFVANKNVNKVYVQYEMISLLFQLPLRVVEWVA